MGLLADRIGFRWYATVNDPVLRLTAQLQGISRQSSAHVRRQCLVLALTRYLSTARS
jgi:hypothetical protein